MGRVVLCPRLMLDSAMKPCTGCKHLNDRFIFGPVCRLGLERRPDDPYTGQQVWRRCFVKNARAEGGFCGPDAVRYELGFWRRLWNRVL